MTLYPIEIPFKNSATNAEKSCSVSSGNTFVLIDRLEVKRNQERNVKRD